MKNENMQANCKNCRVQKGNKASKLQECVQLREQNSKQANCNYLGTKEETKLKNKTKETGQEKGGKAIKQIVRVFNTRKESKRKATKQASRKTARILVTRSEVSK